jgi:hypothetical protein
VAGYEIISLLLLVSIAPIRRYMIPFEVFPDLMKGHDRVFLLLKLLV